MVKTVTEFASETTLRRSPAVVGDSWRMDTLLVINVIPGMAECDECNELFHVIEHEGYCPNCGSFEKTILSGKDFLIREIHIPEG